MIIYLIFLCACIAAFRTRLILSSHLGDPIELDGCETGATKLVGDQLGQNAEYGIKESKEGVMAVLAHESAPCAAEGETGSQAAVHVFSDVFEDSCAFEDPGDSLRRAYLGMEGRGCGAVSAAAVVIRDRMLFYESVGSVRIGIYRNHELIPITFGKRSRMREEEVLKMPVSLGRGELVVLLTDGLYGAAEWMDLEWCFEQDCSCRLTAFRIVQLVNQGLDGNNKTASVVVLKIR